MIIRNRISRRNRRHVQPSQGPLGTVLTATNSVVANKWRVTLNAPANISTAFGDYAAWTVEGVAPTSVTIVGANIFDLGYAVNVAAGQDYVIPAYSGAVTSQRGGFVAAAAGTF